MFSARFRAAIVEGNEVYIFEEAGHQQPTVKSIPFPNSLITFSYMDMDSAAPLFQKAADAFTALIRTHSEKDSREGLSAFWRLGPKKRWRTLQGLPSGIQETFCVDQSGADHSG